jgi:hypothetical protein
MEDAVRETGMRNGAFGVDKFGFDGLAAVHWNLSAPELYEPALAAGEAGVTTYAENIGVSAVRSLSVSGAYADS